ncbi:MAG TPA: tetratricopeptide repeat protein [Pyrinomonadaceae bacterium]|nr:tetratricopeptide repeat protein [Pyrinomonadaceae bacterium]
MKHETCARRRAPYALLPLAALALLACAPRARAQLDPGAAYRTLMQQRMEMSVRAVTEAQRRRFEEGKSDTHFPSDANKAGAKPGTVRVVSPEERKALAHNERGLGHFEKGRVEQAVKEYEEALRAFPSLAAAHNNLGSAHFAAARFEEAASAFRRAAELEPNYGQALFNLALAHLKLGREREADAAIQAAVRAYYTAGDEHFRAGRLKEAEESYRGMLQIDPEYVPALLRLGLVANDTRRFEEAAHHLRRAAAREPANPYAHEGLAEALYGLNKFDEAAASADRALKLAPDSAGAHYFAGLARAASGQRDAALNHLARLKELKSDNYAQLLSDFVEKRSPGK